jgi:uncharacterized protein YndB with AHSA1/START domain
MTPDNDVTQYKTLHITRTFNASRQAVWDAWTKPDHFTQWYSPEHFTIPICELDVKPEGKIRIDMKGPDGTIYPSSGVFKEVTQPERLAFTNSPLDNAGNKLFEVLHSLTLTENEGKTVLSLTSQVLSAGPEAGPYLAGMEVGLNEALQKLENLLS